MGRLDDYINMMSVKRQGWDVDEPAAKFTRSVSDIHQFELHHTGASGPASMHYSDKRQWLLGIERYHENTKGWSDIFYHVFVFADGNIWEGRDLRRSSTSLAANALTVHIPGNDPVITPEQHRSLVTVARWATLGNPAMVRGHSDRSATACPGNNGRAELDAIRRDLSAAAAAVSAPDPDDTTSDMLRDIEELSMLVKGMQVSMASLRTRLSNLESLSIKTSGISESTIEEIRRRLVD
jgi:hypothetical protein